MKVVMVHRNPGDESKNVPLQDTRVDGTPRVLERNRISYFVSHSHSLNSRMYEEIIAHCNCNILIHYSYREIESCKTFHKMSKRRISFVCCDVKSI